MNQCKGKKKSGEKCQRKLKNPGCCHSHTSFCQTSTKDNKPKAVKKSQDKFRCKGISKTSKSPCKREFKEPRCCIDHLDACSGSGPGTGIKPKPVIIKPKVEIKPVIIKPKVEIKPVIIKPKVENKPKPVIIKPKVENKPKPVIIKPKPVIIKPKPDIKSTASGTKSEFNPDLLKNYTPDMQQLDSKRSIKEVNRMFCVSKYDFKCINDNSKILTRSIMKILNAYKPTFICSGLSFLDIESNTIMNESEHLYIAILPDILDIYKDKFNILKNAKTRLIHIAVGLRLEGGEHAIAGVYDSKLKEFEFFDPNGIDDGDMPYYNNVSDSLNIFYQEVLKYIPDAKFLPIKDTCKYMPQQMSNSARFCGKNDSVGYCTIFTLMYGYYRLKYQEYTRDEVSRMIELLAMNDNYYIERFLTFSGIKLNPSKLSKAKNLPGL